MKRLLVVIAAVLLASCLLEITYARTLCVKARPRPNIWEPTFLWDWEGSETDWFNRTSRIDFIMNAEINDSNHWQATNTWFVANTSYEYPGTGCSGGPCELPVPPFHNYLQAWDYDWFYPSYRWTKLGVVSTWSKRWVLGRREFVLRAYTEGVTDLNWGDMSMYMLSPASSAGVDHPWPIDVTDFSDWEISLLLDTRKPTTVVTIGRFWNLNTTVWSCTEPAAPTTLPEIPVMIPVNAPVNPPTEPVSPPTAPVSPPTAPVSPPTAPVSPPTAPVSPPTAPVSPPTAPVSPPTAPVSPPTAPVSPPTAPVSPPTAPVSPPTAPVSPPTAPVSPPTAPVSPPTAPVSPPTAPVSPPTAPVSPPTAPITPPVQPPVGFPLESPPPPVTNPVPANVPVNQPPVISPSVVPAAPQSCNATAGDTSPHCKKWGIHSGWHGPDCGCEVRPTLDCVEHQSGNSYVAHWGYKVWCRRGARAPEVIRQPYGWGNRFLPNPGSRGQPIDFCTDRSQYRNVFTTTFEYEAGSRHNRFKFDAWVLGHRVALLVPSVHVRSKQCSAVGTPHGGSGGNGHEHRDYESLTTEWEDADSDWVTAEYPEYSYGDVRRAQMMDHRLALDASSSFTAAESMTATNPVRFHGRATCTNFAITGSTSAASCYNVTSSANPDLILASGCTQLSKDSTWQQFSAPVEIEPELLNMGFYVTIRPELPSAHRAVAHYSCIPKQRSKLDSSASSLSGSLLLFLALVASLVALL